MLAEEQMLPEVALPVAPEAVEQDVQAEPEVELPEEQLVVVVRLLAWARCPA